MKKLSSSRGLQKIEAMRLVIANEPANIEERLGLAQELVFWYLGECIHRDEKGKDVGDVDRWLIEAQSYIDQVRVIEPDDERIYTFQAAIHKARRQFDLALKESLRLVEVNPKHSQARFEIAQILMYSEQSRDGLEQLEAILEYDPGYLRALFALAQFHNRKGDYDVAQSYYDRLLILQPDAPDIQRLTALNKDRLGSI